jgi:DNA polymerase-3 subunit gamma/tau
VRDRWPDVLTAVRQERKVAWMLLNPATVESLEGGVLTVAFPKEGEAKGFATSGHDQVLTNVLATMLGLNVRVRAIVGSGQGAHRTSPPAPADPAAPGGGARSPRPAAGGQDTGHNAPPAGPPAGATPPGAPRAATGERDLGSGPGGVTVGGPAAPAAAAPAPRQGSAGGAADADEEWPDDAGPAGAGPGPTGMALIEQQLGGRVIEEIEEP